MPFSLTIRTTADPADEAKSRARRTIRTQRDTAIAAGISVDGLRVQSDDLSQQRIVGAALAATVYPGAEVRWKTAHGAFAILVATGIIALAQAVRGHVQKCFDRVAEPLEDLDAGEAPDIDSGWPGTP